MLESTVLSALREKLLSEQAELRELIAAVASGEAASSSIELDQARVGRLTRMDALASAAMSQEVGRRRAMQLKLVKAALRKMDSDGYGDCEACLELINPQRLALNPAVKHCIECASKLE